MTLSAAARAAAYTPRADGEVLERIRQSNDEPRLKQLRKERAGLAKDPNQLELALEVAKSCVEESRRTADPRWLGRAEHALEPWWKQVDPPEPVLVLRATIRQSRHEFPPALADLAQALKKEPRDAQALVTQAAVQQVSGALGPARKSCAALWKLAPRPVAATCLTQVTALSGELVHSRTLLKLILSQDQGGPETPPALLDWSYTALAEMAVRAGDAADAEAQYRIALGLAADDPYLLGSYADFLLDQGRAAEVVPLLSDRTRQDGLLLRLALAERALGAPEAARHVQELDGRFAASRLRGDVVHRREESRFRLQLQADAALALRLAGENFQVQREPADLRVLLEAAIAARDPKAARPALAFIDAAHLEDATLARLRLKLAPDER